MHVLHLRSVLEALKVHGLTVKEGKCQFGKRKVEYLGHVIGGGVLAVPTHRATAMAEYVKPRTKKQLRAFLGAGSYYRKFVQGFARYSSELSPATSRMAPSVVSWTEAMLEAFSQLKVCLVNMCELTIPSQEDVFTLNTCFRSRHRSYIKRYSRWPGTTSCLFQQAAPRGPEQILRDRVRRTCCVQSN